MNTEEEEAAKKAMGQKNNRGKQAAARRDVMRFECEAESMHVRAVAGDIKHTAQHQAAMAEPNDQC